MCGHDSCMQIISKQLRVQKPQVQKGMGEGVSRIPLLFFQFVKGMIQKRRELHIYFTISITSFDLIIKIIRELALSLIWFVEIDAAYFCLSCKYLFFSIQAHFESLSHFLMMDLSLLFSIPPCLYIQTLIIDRTFFFYSLVRNELGSSKSEKREIVLTLSYNI